MLAAALAAAAFAGAAHAYDFEDWPTHYTFSDGTDLGLVLVYRYDVNNFSDDTRPDGSSAFEDSATNRRKELGLSLKKKGVYDAIVDYE
jgi:phosphate-selective porin OprO/OprP